MQRVHFPSWVSNSKSKSYLQFSVKLRENYFCWFGHFLQVGCVFPFSHTYKKKRGHNQHTPKTNNVRPNTHSHCFLCKPAFWQHPDVHPQVIKLYQICYIIQKICATITWLLFSCMASNNVHLWHTVWREEWNRIHIWSVTICSNSIIKQSV